MRGVHRLQGARDTVEGHVGADPAFESAPREDVAHATDRQREDRILDIGRWTLRDPVCLEQRGLDLQRFENPAEIRALPTAADLDEYTFLVAGCVGEFWTRLCFRHVRTFAELGEQEMLALGKRYGMGLQLINILRDAGSDLRAGRCYFPEDELTAAGMTAAQIVREPDRFQPIYQKWAEKAKHGLAAGMQYSHAIQNRRVRAATVLPALIGARTLALLHGAGATMLHRKIKVPRHEVRGMIASLAFTLADRALIDGMFRRFWKL